MADVEYVPIRNNSRTWGWLLLLPVFFILGWLANSYWGVNSNQYRPQTGVGGGPPVSPTTSVTPKASVSPTPTSEVPSGVPTFTLPTGTITP